MLRYIYIAAFTLVLFSCTSNQSDTPVGGNIRILADESFQPIVDAEIDVFQSLYKKTSIQAEYKTENEVMTSFLQSETDMVVAARRLSETEKKYMKEAQKSYMENILAYDAVALVVHKDNPVASLSLAQLEAVFAAKSTTWDQLGSAVKEDIYLVMDNSNSGNFNYLKNMFSFETEKLKISSAGSNKKVLEYVQTNKNAIGIIGINHISDLDSPEVKDIVKSIQILDIQGEDGIAYSPFQSDLASGNYPLRREIVLITTAKKSGLAAGFTAFLLSDRGQRIVLKSGLVPSQIPGREIVVRK
jgi:phosphate transport system substrate-binding protein